MGKFINNTFLIPKSYLKMKRTIIAVVALLALVGVIMTFTAGDNMLVRSHHHTLTHKPEAGGRWSAEQDESCNPACEKAGGYVCGPYMRPFSYNMCCESKDLCKQKSKWIVGKYMDCPSDSIKDIEC